MKSKQKINLLKEARMTKQHFYDIYNAIDIAYCDACNASTKRSYSAAQKALMRLEKVLNECHKSAKLKE